MLVEISGRESAKGYATRRSCNRNWNRRRDRMKIGRADYSAYPSWDTCKICVVLMARSEMRMRVDVGPQDDKLY